MQPQAHVPLGEGMATRAKLSLMLTLMLAMFVSALNQQIVSTATPRILADLGGFSLLSWMFTAYMLTSTVVTPLVGKLSDTFGRRIFLIGGIMVFAAGSLATGMSPNMPFLIAARGIQGIGGGAIMAAVFSTIGDLFAPAERAKYMGLFTGTFTLASLFGPTVGGAVTDTIGWRWCFFLNVPLTLAAGAVIWFRLPAHVRRGTRPAIDYTGAVLLSMATVSLLLGLVWAQDRFGWGGAPTVGLLVAAVVLTGLFIAQERRHPEAVIPLDLFKNRIFVVANLTTFILGGAMFGAITYLPTFIQTSLGKSATTSGLLMTPQHIGLLITSLIGGQFISRLGRYKIQTTIGTILVVTGMFLMSTLDVNSPAVRVSMFVGVIGLGFGLVMPTMSVVIQNAVSPQRIGVATSSRQFFMSIGQVLGAAVFGVVLANSYASAFDDAVPANVRDQVPAATLDEFHDPTLPLDKNRLPRVEAEIRALPGGEALLAGALAASRVGVAKAVNHIFLGAFSLGLVAIVLTFALKEVPLRKGFGAPSAEVPKAGTPPGTGALAPESTGVAVQR